MRFFQSIALFFRRLFALDGGDFLCDRCKYNDARYCSRPDRPNATECPDYKELGA